MSGLERIEQAEEDFEVEVTDLGKPNIAVRGISSWFVGRVLVWQRPENWRRLRLVQVYRCGVRTLAHGHQVDVI